MIDSSKFYSFSYDSYVKGKKSGGSKANFFVDRNIFLSS